MTAQAKRIHSGTDYTKEFLYFNSLKSGACYMKECFRIVYGYYLQQDRYIDNAGTLTKGKRYVKNSDNYKFNFNSSYVITKVVL